MSTSRVASIVGAVLVVASLFIACSLGVSPKPTDCGNGIPGDIGGCENLPAYEGTTCEPLSAEWGQEVNDRLLAVIAEPAVVNEMQRSARVHGVLVLATVTLGLHLDRIGLLGACRSAQVLLGAQPAFGAELRAAIGGVLYDNDPPAAWSDFEAEALTVLRSLDVPPAS